MNWPNTSNYLTKHYGAEVCLVPGVYDDAYQKALQLRDEKGYTFVHPFDDENVIAGQGTIGHFCKLYITKLRQMYDFNWILRSIK